MTEVNKRRKRIRERVPLGALLQAYGYEVTQNGGVQQFRCDLHGSGVDNKPSARYYGEDSWYCFACGRSRDAVSTVMEKEGVEYKRACMMLEKKYGLPTYDDSETSEEQAPLGGGFSLDKNDNPEERVYRLLLSRTRDRVGEPEGLLKLWEAHDMLKFKGNAQKSQWERLLRVLLEG